MERLEQPVIFIHYLNSNMLTPLPSLCSSLKFWFLVVVGNVLVLNLHLCTPDLRSSSWYRCSLCLWWLPGYAFWLLVVKQTSVELCSNFQVQNSNQVRYFRVEWITRFQEVVIVRIAFLNLGFNSLTPANGITDRFWGRYISLMRQKG